MELKIGQYFGLSIILICISTFLLRLDKEVVVSANIQVSSVPNDKYNVFANTKVVDRQTRDYGNWSVIDEDGYVEWEYTITEDASSLNFGFSEFVLPSSAVFTICNAEGKSCQEFTPHKNTTHHLDLWTPILKGNTAKFKLRVLASEKELLKLRLTSINRGQQMQRLGDDPELCLIDVQCTDLFPQIAAYESEIQSVGLITIEGTKVCSGVLLNNVKQDFTPYFLTARHCGINAENASSVVVHWNFNNSICRYETEENAMEGDGSLAQFNSGATFLADLQRSDFTLLRLDNPVTNEANAFYAGWDASAAAPEDVVTVHHANTQEKRITFGKGKTSITRHFGEDEDPDLNHIRVGEWDISSTASGSSGAPLFDKNHRVVGQLHGGLAACDNKESDWFGRLHTSWLGDSIPERQLKHWLDPDDSGLEIINGIWDELEPLALQISVQQLSEVNCPGDSTASIRVDLANGTGPYRFSIDGGKTFQFQPQFQNLGAGIYAILVKDATENTSAIVPYIIDAPEEMIFMHTQIYNQITLSIEGGVAPYLFSYNGSISFDSVFNNVPMGALSYSVVDANGCSKELIIEANYPEFQAQIENIKGISCFDSEDGIISIVHSGTVGPYLYQLNNGELKEDNAFDNLPPGQYIARVIDSLGNIAQSNVIQLDAPQEMIANVVQVEENIIVEVSGGVAPYLYQFDTGSFGSENQFSISDGVQVIRIKDTNGCEIEIENLYSTSKEVAEQIRVSLFPNPAEDVIFLDAGDQILESFEILNLQGQTLIKGKYPTGYDQKSRIDINNLDAGVYFFRARIRGKGIKTLRFIVL